ncbi:MAG: M15 family metallopeptidase [Ilumatobacteraceae bacterium]|nr:M15 family metallopeptidase [Ilumatobacteraceae bacterium]
MWLRLSVLLGAGIVALALPVIAVGPPSNVEGPATATQRAEPVTPLPDDVVSVYNVGPLSETTASRAFAAAREAGATAAIGRVASVGMTAVRRGEGYVQRPPSGFAYPMGTTVLPLEVIGRTMSRDVSRVLRSNTVVMGERTAGLRGAQAGDVLDLTSATGATVQLRVAQIAPDEVIGGTELLISPDAADRLGIARLSRVVIWDFADRAAIDRALVRNALVSTSIRIRRSWDPPDPDSTLGMARMKEELGEFAYRVNPDGTVSTDAAWRNANIVDGAVGQLRLQTGCHTEVRNSLRAAMSEVIAEGLEDTINYLDANRYGGCYYPRFNRLTPDSSLGFLSRHSWGGAVDTNTQDSCQGCAPPDLDCRTVRIFRKHGFAWGGNFLLPDGMHFEWVGEPRDQLPYPSRFCGNIVDRRSAPADDGDAPTQRATLYADAGLTDAHSHGTHGYHDHDH